MSRPTEQELKAYAEFRSERIVIRTWDRGNSYDESRAATKEEKQVLESVIYGGLLAIRSGNDKRSVMAACEYIGNIQMKNIVAEGEMNGYDSIYIPIGEYPEMN